MKQIPCFKHEGSFILFIKVEKDKTEFVCDECCLDLQTKSVNVNYQELIHVKNALKSPEFFLSKLKISTPVQEYLIKLDKCNKQAMDNILEEFETKISQIQNILLEVQQELKNQVNCILEKKNKIRDELQKITQFDKFKQFAINFQQLGDNIKHEDIIQNEKILHQYLEDLTKNDCNELNQKLIDVLDRIKREPEDPNQEFYPQYRELERQFKSLNFSQAEFVQQFNLIYFVQVAIIYDGRLMSYYQQQKIMSILQSRLNKKVINFQQIYLGTRDGLNGQSFWSKVQGNTNLLMIFKSKSGYIFGGFSPCQWQQYVNAYVQDNTMSSFIFSQTHDQIYHLKEANKTQAIYCHQSYGPTFGAYDIYFGADFQSGSSNLGTSYQCDQYQIATKNTHLFGQTTPNIVECEIYQVKLC
ncbi:unnamed protein product (macronuclear) [Paramecium tetraurelia]|uniref:TLDc domain-containing protein n=1 Tax=Paramecium tetraurelia TaxID=5888 RepID=A0BY43_PARTE|nr:uncharacterized protein GSPATT00033313001 [Paramecium tetraurelia]CAK63460.1 unnamed protein product [Paramecium tetraurelia]|eukprot:XP_001430858.1 hypothetical protein (macronuclear) [Paramecium tetraurelia strain d4-2]